MRPAAVFFLFLGLIAAAPAAAQDAAIASLTEPQLKALLLGEWTLSLGFGPGPLTITDLKDGQLAVTGKMILNYDTLTVTRGHIDGDKVTLNFNAGSLQGALTSPRHMQGSILFRGDTSGSTATWFADKVEH